MNYPAYNPYAYGQFGPQQVQQGPFMPQAMAQPQPMQGPMQGPVQGQQGLSQTSRPVASKEEAMAVAADFSGSLMVFPDITHDRVYIKRWNFQTGAADFIEFSPVLQAPPQQEQAQNPLEAFSMQDFQDLAQNLQDVAENLRQEVDRLKRPQAPAKAAVKKEKTDADT